MGLDIPERPKVPVLPYLAHETEEDSIQFEPDDADKWGLWVLIVGVPALWVLIYFLAKLWSR